MTLFIPLLLAHILGDFILQPNVWVIDKEKNKIKSYYLYMHIFTHILIMLILTKFEARYFYLIIFIAIIHYLIDLLKLYLQEARTKKLWFFLDQFLHLSTITVACSFQNTNLWADILVLIYNPKSLWLICCLLLTTYVTSIIQKIILSRWMKPFNEEENKPSNNAGTFIGILERLFIFLFISVDVWAGIGFLLAAKTIFRIGDLSRSKDYAVTEYILIGTFLSFGFGISYALLYKTLMPFL